MIRNFSNAEILEAVDLLICDNQYTERDKKKKLGIIIKDILTKILK